MAALGFSFGFCCSNLALSSASSLSSFLVFIYMSSWLLENFYWENRRLLRKWILVRVLLRFIFYIKLIIFNNQWDPLIGWGSSYRITGTPAMGGGSSGRTGSGTSCSRSSHSTDFLWGGSPNFKICTGSINTGTKACIFGGSNKRRFSQTSSRESRTKSLSRGDRVWPLNMTKMRWNRLWRIRPNPMSSLLPKSNLWLLIWIKGNLN